MCGDKAVPAGASRRASAPSAGDEARRRRRPRRDSATAGGADAVLISWRERLSMPDRSSGRSRHNGSTRDRARTARPDWMTSRSPFDTVCRSAKTSPSGACRSRAALGSFHRPEERHQRPLDLPIGRGRAAPSPRCAPGRYLARPASRSTRAVSGAASLSKGATLLAFMRKVSAAAPMPSPQRCSTVQTVRAGVAELREDRAAHLGSACAGARSRSRSRRRPASRRRRTAGSGLGVSTPLKRLPRSRPGQDTRSCRCSRLCQCSKQRMVGRIDVDPDGE